MKGGEIGSISRSELRKPELNGRLDRLTSQFAVLFGEKSSLPSFINSPGRCEWLGNHTDYNGGVAVGVAIDRSVLSAFHANDTQSDPTVRIFSNQIPGLSEPITFSLEELTTIDKPKKGETKWTDYIKGVLREFVLRADTTTQLKGLDILLDSDVPISGGTSSSAAVELAIAGAFAKVNDITLSKQEIALLCQHAEVDFVGSECGFLDQGSVAYGQEGNGVRFKFHPDSPSKPADVELVDIDVEKHGYSYMIAVDPTVKRMLGESGYPIRKKQCNAGLQELKSLLLGLSIENLGDIPLDAFLSVKSKMTDTLIANRVHHVIAESDRVGQALKAVKRWDMKTLGEIFNESGKSGLEKFGLDEATPELTELCEAVWSEEMKQLGVYGRNMGGGFAANVLMLVPTDQIAEIQNKIQGEYAKKCPGTLEFIPFTPAHGVMYIDS